MTILQDNSKNRTFTVSDGLKTANIKLTGNFSSITLLINNINAQLIRDAVSAIAEKVDETHFSIKSISPDAGIIIDGLNKVDFF